jgi:hypothetical protein
MNEIGYRDNAKPAKEPAIVKTKCGLAIGLSISIALASFGATAISRRYESRHPPAPPPCRNHAIVVGSDPAYCDPDQEAQLVNGRVLFCTCRRK